MSSIKRHITLPLHPHFTRFTPTSASTRANCTTSKHITPPARIMSTKIGHGLAKVLGIKLDYRHELGNEKVTRGESVFSVSSADTYVEQEPTIAEWFRETLPNGRGLLNYFLSLFPFISWLPFYNLQWLAGDMVAGKRVMSRVFTSQILIDPRYHYRRRCRSARNGICTTRPTPRLLRSLHFLHGCPYLLAVRYVKRHHHRSMWFLARYPSLQVCY